MPLILIFLGTLVLSFIVDAAKSASQKPSGDVSKNVAEDISSRLKSLIESESATASNAASTKGRYSGDITSMQRERLEQLRKLQQQRKNAANGKANAEKPLYAHPNSECGGGSIHDGYHEGSVRRPAQAYNAEGRLGKQGVSRNEGNAAAKASCDELVKAQPQPAHDLSSDGEKSTVRAPIISGPEKLAKAISGKPAIVQGLIWKEVLGRPLSDS